jgi:serine/threonine-protein kinase RsbT
VIHWRAVTEGGHRGGVRVESEDDIVSVRRAVRDAAKEIGFGVTDLTRIVTAVSELTRNIVLYADCGEVRWSEINSAGKRGMELIFEDEGPGIADLELALEKGYSTGGGLGLGLPGAKRLMDEMEIESEAGHGTKVMVRKWRR